MAAGTAAGVGLLAGCPGGPSEQPATNGDGTTETTTASTGDGAGGRDLSVTIEPSTSVLDWGEEYSVTVTLTAGTEPLDTYTRMAYRTEGVTDWETIEGTNATWHLDAGSSETRTFDIVPPATGEITCALVDDWQYDTVLEQWELAVASPQAALGETISFYDGLDVTVAATFAETVPVTLFSYGNNRYDGEYSIRPEPVEATTWALVTLTAENTTSNNDVSPPEDRDVTVLASSRQLEIQGLMFSDDPPRFELVEDPPDDLRYSVQLNEEPWYYDPPRDLVPTATAEGQLPYVTSTDTTLDDVTVLVSHDDVRARWG